MGERYTEPSNRSKRRYHGYYAVVSNLSESDEDISDEAAGDCGVAGRTGNKRLGRESVTD